MERDCNLQMRYYYNNSWFAKGNADAIYYMIRFVKPETIIEVGSGYSIAVMLDTNEDCFNNEMKILSIEPNAERLKTLLKSINNIVIYDKNYRKCR